MFSYERGMTFDDFDMPFPLWKAPVENAIAERDAPCRHCRKTAAWTFDGACYACLRAGKRNKAIDSELGMVRPEDADDGLTHGLPLDDPSALAGWELVRVEADEPWYRVRVDPRELHELLRTPRFHSWQGSTWLFCCKKACVFVGDLPREARNVDAIAKAFDTPDDSEELLERIEDESVCTYAFRCRACGRLRAYYDMD